MLVDIPAAQHKTMFFIISLDLHVFIDNYPVQSASTIATADIVLLGPQVKYEQAKLQAQAEPLGKKVAVIDMMDYGMMKGDAVLEKALKLLES